jgi:G3E family GTPase
MTKLVLLLGFLGSGKTTLMQKILNKYADRKIGILVNDFGRLNVDSILLERNGIPMQELSNGSIFCACIKANFYDSLTEMSRHGLEYLFIEASGLVDPSSMPDILETIAPRLQTPYNFTGSICVVDSKNFLKLIDVFPAVGNQVDYANAIIINKSDLADAESLNTTKEKIFELNPEAMVFCTSYCEVDIPAVVEGLSFSRDTGRESTDTYESRPKSLMIEGDGIYNKKDIAALIESLSPHAYRI